MTEFASRLIAWHRVRGRHDLPWQLDPSPYRVWVSEIMLQQTRVATVIPYFRCFIARFPDVRALAEASLDEVLHLWSGLGYYARARNLHRAAQVVCREHGGKMPEDLESLMRLPGIGRSTAGAILALGGNRPFPILDGNVKRVLCRFHGIRGYPGEREVESRLWKLAEKYVPLRRAAEYTQAIMDLGATVCTRGTPACGICPLQRNCEANRRGLTGQIPAPRPRRMLPVRRATLALIRNPSGEILLEQRPPAGIWGGLWSLPECPPGRDVVDWVRDRFGWQVERVEAVPGLRHTFTHFHLDIEPVQVTLASAANGVGESTRLVWQKRGVEIRRGLAAPIRKLITGEFRHSRERGKIRRSREMRKSRRSRESGNPVI